MICSDHVIFLLPLFTKKAEPDVFEQFIFQVSYHFYFDKEGQRVCSASENWESPWCHNMHIISAAKIPLALCFHSIIGQRFRPLSDWAAPAQVRPGLPTEASTARRRSFRPRFLKGRIYLSIAPRNPVLSMDCKDMPWFWNTVPLKAQYVPEPRLLYRHDLTTAFISSFLNAHVMGCTQNPMSPEPIHFSDRKIFLRYFQVCCLVPIECWIYGNL